MFSLSTYFIFTKNQLIPYFLIANLFNFLKLKRHRIVNTFIQLRYGE